MTSTNNTNTALQVTNFDFYGDNLIALQDNATGEIYTAINSILRGIGFTDKDQIRKRRDKWINDVVISKGVVKFNIPTQEVVAKNDTTLFDEKETYCISQHKLPLALAKINITPKMKQNQPESEIIHLVIQETEDTYNIEINDYVDAYKSEFNLDTNPYAIDVINHYKDIKDMFTLTLEAIMNKLNLSDNTKSASKNIFDILAEEINSLSTNKAS